MRICANFDGGNIEIIDATDKHDVKLGIRKDNRSDFRQWFLFRLESEPQTYHQLTIMDLDQTAYPDGWSDYRAVASYDRKHWFRVPTQQLNNQLIIQHTLAHNICYFAYFAPYSYEQHLDLLAWAQQDPRCRLHHLGETLDGRDMTLLQFGTAAAGKPKIWITARQHPGETMAEWLVEGLLKRLVDQHDALSRSLLAQAVFYLVPNMNPDGSVRGHLRTNARGVNLNREWGSPSMQDSPEVYLVLQKMQEIGVDMYLDVHGDEALPYNFLVGCEGNPSYGERIQSLEASFKQSLLVATPEFQTTYGYDIDQPGEANLTIAANAVGEQFDCLSFTLEMPFKDNNNIPDPVCGWSPERSKQLGADILCAIHSVVGRLR